MLSAKAVTKRYGPILAVDGISLEVAQGEVFGLLGSNGAGKTTLMKIFATLLRPDAGTASVAGIDVIQDPLAVRACIGFVPDSAALYDKLTGREFLHLVAKLRGIPIPRAEQGIAEVSYLLRMDEELARECDGLSRGMKQKLALASAMFHKPPVLILDEPTNGLDPRFAKLLKGWLKDYARAGNTVLMSTHVTQVAEAICDRVAIVHEGRIAAEGSVAEVAARADARTLEDAFSVIVGEA